MPIDDPAETPATAQAPTTVTQHDPATAAHPEHPTRGSNLRALLTDGLGHLSIRSLQVIVVLILAAGVVFALVQLKLVVIPVLIALILAAALSPVMRWLKGRGLSAIVATWITLVAGILIFGGIVTLIVFAVRGQWEQLRDSAAQGIDDLGGFIGTLPFEIDQAQLDSAKDAVGGFFTSSQFGSGALAG
ncbi:MAG: AI-2E family transporter, partial [Herbiconiux sp.]|nr:AI-2E family transporter [Herbiconiux sp.]